MTVSSSIRRGHVEFAFVVATVVATGLARLAPVGGAGAAFRLAAATTLLVAPVAVVARRLPVPTAAATFVVALGLVAVALAVMFAVHGSLSLALAVYAGEAALCLAVAALWLRMPSVTAGTSRRAAIVCAAVGGALGIALWGMSGPLSGDALFHLARIRKLLAFSALKLSSVDEFRDGGLHPGYAFPLLHGLLAFVSRIAGLDPATVVRHEPTILAVAALIVAFELGVAVFDDVRLGIAFALVSVALFAVAAGHGGSYVALALPATFARQIVAPALLALALPLLADRRADDVRTTAGFAALAAAELALVHVTYFVFVAILLVATAAVAAIWRRQLQRSALVVIAATAVGGGAVIGWLEPLVATTRSHNPTCNEVRRALTNYPNEIVYGSCHHYHLAAAVASRSGALAVAGLLLAPLAVLATGRAWAALVTGGTAILLSLLLIPWLFPHFADAVSISQARRAAGFVPFTFALVGGAAVLALRLRWLAVPLALGAGIWLELAYPGWSGGALPRGLPSYPAWVALAGTTTALVIGMRAYKRSSGRDCVSAALATVGAFSAPVLVGGFLHWTQLPPPDQPGPSPALVSLLRQPVLRGSVVFSDPQTSYALAAAAPVYVASAPVQHVANTTANDPYRRRNEARRFLDTGNLGILHNAAACTLVVHRPTRLRLHLPVVYRDRHFVAFAVQPRWPHCR